MAMLVSITISYIIFYVIFALIDKHIFQGRLEEVLGHVRFVVVLIAAILWPISIALLFIGGAILLINRVVKK